MPAVQSKIIASVDYDPSMQTMYITFKTGAIYQYPNTNPDEYQALLNAGSVGSFFHTNFKGKNNQQVKPPSAVKRK